MLPQVQEFLDAENAASDKYQEARRNLNIAHPYPSYNDPNYQAKCDAHAKADAEAYAECLATIDAALDKLASTEDRTLTFLARTAFKLHPSETRDVLRMLPLSRETLEAVGPDQGWCPEYGRLFHLAEEQGVLPPYTDATDPFNHLNIGKLVAELMENRYEASSLQIRKMLKRHLEPQLRALLGTPEPDAAATTTAS